MTSSFTRVNGPEETKNESVRAATDVFHAAKSMGKNALIERSSIDIREVVSTDMH